MSFSFNYQIVIGVILAIGGRFAAALECYNCDNVSNLSNCTTTTHCSNGHSCYLNVSSNGFTLGCIENQQCGGLSNIAGSLVGRSIIVDVAQDRDQHVNDDSNNYINVQTDYAKRDSPSCLECCSAEICNKHLCEHLKPTACIDDFKVDCALMNSIFSICKNIHEAKAVCPKFCGLCSLVDGNWADWSAWSGCDVTCANGTQTRTRKCVNPTPVAGGLDCPGSTNETKICNLQHCPVDGIWTDWLSWSPCDVTCENGTQTRTRSCSNPLPAYNGQNCTGNSVDTIFCMKDSCPVHGGWTQWFSWEPCSVTCDFGIQRRLRNCTNPIPDRFGDHCFGRNIDDRICQPGPCANGGWSDWGTWTPCSTTCDGGIRSRERTCTNPRPSALGRQCEGNTLQYVSCNNNRCLSPTVAFRSKDLRSLSASQSRTLVFTNTLLNVGNGYNNSTGIFTAPVSGTYSFTCQLCMRDTEGTYFFYVVVHNNNDIANGLLTGYSVQAPCNNFDAIAVLKANDTVWIRIHSGSGSFYSDSLRWNMFSGMLVHD